MAGVKMSDIAKASGVSIATVGRVLHRSGYVSEEARERVEKAISELGYVPNAMARALKRQKSGIIGNFVVHNQNNLYQKINSSIITAAEDKGYKIITLQGRSRRNDEDDIINQFVGMQVDGLVVTSNNRITAAQLTRLHRLSIPVVAVERTYDHPFVDNIIVKDREGTLDATRRFLEKGHRRLALIAVDSGRDVEKRRIRGYCEAMKEQGFSQSELLIQAVKDYSLEDGKAAMQALLSLPNPPTGVICTADTLAAGAMQALHLAGKSVPADMSISGYDNVLAAQLAPPIDSVDLDLEKIGELIFSLLQRRMENPNAPGKSEYLDTVYVSRGTISPLS